MRSWLLRWVRNPLRERPVAPAVAALIFASLGAISSVLVAPLDQNYRPNPVLSWVALGVGVVAVAYFALASYSVLGERVVKFVEERPRGKPMLPAWDELSDAAKTKKSEPDRAADKQPTPASGGSKQSEGQQADRP